jgi:UDP-N-acetylglucosamine 2-epimerase (non-hydrolysing)
MRVAVVFGTRPEAIKLAPVAMALDDVGIHTDLIATGQHHDDVVEGALEAFDMKPTVMFERVHADLAAYAGEAVGAIASWLGEERPDVVVVQGDTTSAWAGAWAGFLQRIPVAHVEAGLRTDDLWSPFPEEANRRGIGTVASLHLAPTPRAADNLRREQTLGKIVVVGQTGVDAVYHLCPDRRPGSLEFYAAAGRSPRILVTAHRRENWGAGIDAIASAIRSVAHTIPGVRVDFLTHPNPDVALAVKSALRGVSGVRLHDPMPYASVVERLASTDLLVTDSGGLQEDACALGIPTVVCRDTSERPEAIEAGVAVLAGRPDADRIADLATRFLTDECSWTAAASAANPFGDGQAAHRIVSELVSLAGR